MATGAARLMVRTGSRTSESTELMVVYPLKDLEKSVSQKKRKKTP